MAISCDESKVAAQFTNGVSISAEWELAIDETALTVSVAPNLCVVTELSVTVREEEECVRDFMDHLSGEESAVSHLVLGEEPDDSDRFVDIITSFSAVDGAESEGWMLAHALARASLSVETLAECVVDTSHLLSC